MFKLLFDTLGFFWDLLKIPLLIIFAFVVFMLALTFIHYLILRRGGMKKYYTDNISHIKQHSIFRRFFIDFPHILAHDYLNTPPDDFSEYGLIVFTGRQGRGKTISLVQYLDMLKDRYKNLICLTNFGFTREDLELEHWKQLIEVNNGRLGVAVGIDELQNWFSSADSKYFPPDMLTVITQNRKNRRVICGTAQVFTLLSKPIRTQCTEIRECHTFFKCITFVFRKEPILDFEGNVIELKNRGSYFFVHTPELRDKYDTYKAISRLAKSGFVNKNEIYE